MKRRDLIKSAGLAGISLGAAPTLSFSKPVDTTNVTNCTFFKFKFGDLELLSLTDGHGLFKPAQPFFAPSVNGEQLHKVLYDNYNPADTIDLAFNILVIRKEKRIILIDTGSGSLFGPGAGQLNTSLKAVGIATGDVTDIILTHAHPDHIGGVADESMNPAFAKADIHIAKVEYDFWNSATPDFSKCKGDGKVYEPLITVARKYLAAIKDKIKFFNSGDVLFDFISLRIIPGHTPGHTVCTIKSNGHQLIHMADISHDHTVLLAHPEWGVVVDTDFQQAGAARRNTLQEFSESRQLLFSYHLPWPGLGYIRKKGTGFEWIPKAYATPLTADQTE